jgi:hypothetical protein
VPNEDDLSDLPGGTWLKVEAVIIACTVLRDGDPLGMPPHTLHAGARHSNGTRKIASLQQFFPLLPGNDDIPKRQQAPPADEPPALRLTVVEQHTGTEVGR